MVLDLAQDNSDLGAVLNGFSLNESGPLAASLEKTGQAVDTTYLSTTLLVSLSLNERKSTGETDRHIFFDP